MFDEDREPHHRELSGFFVRNVPVFAAKRNEGACHDKQSEKPVEECLHLIDCPAVNDNARGRGQGRRRRIHAGEVLGVIFFHFAGDVLRRVKKIRIGLRFARRNLL